MYKGPNDRHYDKVIELGLKLKRDGLSIPYYVLLRVIDTTSIDVMKSSRELADTFDLFEDLAMA